MKPFAAITALKSGKYDVDTLVDPSPGYYRLMAIRLEIFVIMGKWIYVIS